MPISEHMGPEGQARLNRLATLYTVLMGFGLAILLAAALHAVALANVAASRTLEDLDAQLAAARRAAFIEPWNSAFAVRVATLRAERMLEEGRPEEALAELRPFELTTDDGDYRAAYAAVRRTLEAQEPTTSGTSTRTP